MDILHQPIIIRVIIPFVLAIVAYVLELIASLVKGLENGEHKYRIWSLVHQEGESTKQSTQNLSLRSIKSKFQNNNENILDIEKMASFNIGNFAPIGIDLIIGAFAVDITTLLEREEHYSTAGYVLMAHLILLAGILVFTMRCQLAEPDHDKERKFYSSLAITLGIIAMMIALSINKGG